MVHALAHLDDAEQTHALAPCRCAPPRSPAGSADDGRSLSEHDRTRPLSYTVLRRRPRKGGVVIPGRTPLAANRVGAAAVGSSARPCWASPLPGALSAADHRQGVPGDSHTAAKNSAAAGRI